MKALAISPGRRGIIRPQQFRILVMRAKAFEDPLAAALCSGLLERPRPTARGCRPGTRLPSRASARSAARLAGDFLVTAACHAIEAVRRPEIHAVHAVLVSPVFASRSASAAGVEPLGVKGVRALVEVSPVPVYGLGGINCDTIGTLKGSGLSGVAAVDAFGLSD